MKHTYCIADNTSIFPMIAVVHVVDCAVQQATLLPIASHIIKMNGATSLTKTSAASCHSTCKEHIHDKVDSKKTTDHSNFMVDSL